MRSPSSVLAVLAVLWVLFPSCSSDKRVQSDAGTDTDTDTDTDSDTDTDGDAGADEWCPELPTSCPAPTALEICGEALKSAPRLIAPLSGKYVRDRRPEIVWDGIASGTGQYRVEIARDRAFTEVVYRSTTYEPYPAIDNRYRHIVSCDLDCGVHFFRVVSVTAPECEVGTSTYTWEMYVGMAPYDLDRDGVPDIMCWQIQKAGGEFEHDMIRGYAIFDLDEKGGQVLAESDLELVAEIEADQVQIVYPYEQGDVDGDGAFDVGLNVSYEGTATDYPFEYIVFSGWKRGGILNGEDALYRITGIEGNDNAGSHAWGSRFSFNDLNGDGRSDLVLISKLDPTGAWYVVYGTTEGFQGSIENADVQYSQVEDKMWSAGNPLDYNGDGFADLLGEVLDTTSTSTYPKIGIAVQLGGDNLADEIGVLDGAVFIAEEDSDVILGEWNLGIESRANPALGDIDFDGYPEVGAELPDATSSTATGSVFIMSNLTGAMDVPFSEMMDTVFLGFFPWEANPEEEYPRSVMIIPTGDIDGDTVVDLLFRADSNDHGYNRYFGFSGRTTWEETYAANAADDILEEDWTASKYSFEYLSDLDGDGLPEREMFGTQCDGLGILLSSSAEEICIPSELIDQCTYGQGFLLPLQLM